MSPLLGRRHVTIFITRKSLQTLYSSQEENVTIFIDKKSSQMPYLCHGLYPRLAYQTPMEEKLGGRQPLISSESNVKAKLKTSMENHHRKFIGPLRIDVTVTSPCRVFRLVAGLRMMLSNVPPFTPSHFQQSSKQFFLALSLNFLWNGFFEICLQSKSALVDFIGLY